jgi:uncharacterized membrane protein YkgB
MVCGISCSIAIVLLVANLYVTFSADKTHFKDQFYKTLSEEQISRYENIIKERRNIYLQGYALGLVLAALFVFTMTKKMNTISTLCVVGAITLVTNYFYYMLTPKSDYMALHLDKEEQRRELINLNSTMQFKYHVGLLLGIIAAMVLTNGLCK